MWLRARLLAASVIAFKTKRAPPHDERVRAFVGKALSDKLFVPAMLKVSGIADGCPRKADHLLQPKAEH